MRRAALVAAAGGALAVLLAFRRLRRLRRLRLCDATRVGALGMAGMGNMGLPIAQQLIQHHHALTVWNRTVARCDALRKQGVIVAPSLGYLLSSCNTVLLMLSNDEAVLGAVSSIPPGGALATLVCLSTISPACAKQAEKMCQEQGIAFVCCPVTGRPEAAAQGRLAAWISGSEPAAVEMVAQHICPAFAWRISVRSKTDVAAAPTFKLITNFLIYGAAELAAEATALSLISGQPRSSISDFLDVIAPGTFLSQYARKIRDEEYHAQGGAGMDVGIKDCRLIQGLAQGATMPVLEAALEHMESEAADSTSSGNSDQRMTEWCALARTVERRINARKWPPTS